MIWKKMAFPRSEVKSWKIIGTQYNQCQDQLFWLILFKKEVGEYERGVTK